MTLFLGLDLGGTNVRAVVADPDATIVGRDERTTPREDGDAIVAALAASARAALAAAGARLADVAAAGCAAPGPLDHRTGVVHEAPNLRGFAAYPLAERLAHALDGARVFVDRDTAAAAIGERLAGAARGSDDFVYVTVSTGLGGAIVSGGRMLRGAAATAGEIGHLQVSLVRDPGGDRSVGVANAGPRARDDWGLEPPRCGCGSIGCVESYAAGRNLAEQLGVAGADEVYAAARAGDDRARALVARAEAALGNLAVSLVNVLNPSLIVVGGSVAEHQPSHVLDPMRRAIAERAFRVPAAAVRVVPAALGPDVGMIGAALLARERAAGTGTWFL